MKMSTCLAGTLLENLRNTIDDRCILKCARQSKYRELGQLHRSATFGRAVAELAVLEAMIREKGR